nr:PREDICTED: uncharacterized protein LOC105667461 [Linepithema humile]
MGLLSPNGCAVQPSDAMSMSREKPERRHGQVLRDPRKRYAICGPKICTLELRSHVHNFWFRSVLCPRRIDNTERSRFAINTFGLKLALSSLYDLKLDIGV